MKYLIEFITKLLYSAIVLFWIFDICNMPFMAEFDTTYPINGLVWTLIFVFILAGESIFD